MLKKHSILQINKVYTAHAFASGENFYVGAGSETDPVVQLYNMETGDARQLEDCPGGMMSFIPVPGRPGSMVTIMGLFPPFIGKEAGLYYHRKGPGGWKSQRAMDLPFAHRCEFLPGSDYPVLIAATVSKYKEDPADWSRPGELFAISMEHDDSESWVSKVIDSSITRNHGMTKSTVDGIEKLCVSGREGIFTIEQASGGGWNPQPLFEKEVSEMTFVDLDGDGKSELVTIEPFHGNTLNIYKRIEGAWKLKYSDSLSFGHGLSSGIFNGQPVIVAGNRSESLELQIFTAGNLDKGAVNKKVIEEGAGPTQTQVFAFGNQDYILSANQRKNEVALYSGSLDN